MLLTIEKLIYGGDGLARLPADEHGRGKAVFVPFTLAGEKVEAALVEQKPGFARARAHAIVERSPYRIDAGCPHFTRCGGCHYQHAAYEHQLATKKEILIETLRRVARIEPPSEVEVHRSPEWNYRNRSRLQVRTKPEFAAGYFKAGSHDLLAVEQCPISSPLVNRGIAALWRSGAEGRVPEGVREIEFFANADDSRLLVETGCASGARRAAVRDWAESFREAVPEVCGIVAFREGRPGSPPEQFVSLGESSLTYRASSASYRVSAGSFFQTNRHLIDELVRIVVQDYSGELAHDLYAGVGLFSTALAANFRHVMSVESSPASSADLAANLPSNAQAVCATIEEYLSGGPLKPRVGLTAEIARQGKSAATSGDAVPVSRPDLVVVDPPRAGLGDRVAKALGTLGAPRIVYVSCDPSTLARDLVPLIAGGYRMKQVHLVDLFPQTYHIETVVHLAR